MGFSGNLASMSLADIFQNLAANGQSGTLKVERGEARRYVYFQGGLIADAAREHTGQGLRPLAGYFAGRCLINEDQAEYALRRVEETDANLARVIPEVGYASEEEVKRLVSRYVEEEVYDLFTWESGEFEFTDGEAPEGVFGPESASVGVRLPTGGLVMEAARRIDEWGRIRNALPSGREVFIADESAEKRAEALDPVSQRVLGLADGTRDIDDLVADSYLSRFEIGGILSSFLEESLLRAAEIKDLEGAAQDLVRRRRPERAVKVYERLISLGQDTPEMRKRLAETAVQANDPGRAIIHLGVLADGEMEAGRGDKAAEIWRQMLEVMPGNTRAHQGLAEHYRGKRQQKQCLKHYAELVRAHARAGATDRAAAAARAGLEVDGRAIELRTLLAEALLEAGRRSEAADEFETLGDQLLESHRTRGAADAYRRVLQIDQGRKGAKQQLTAILAAEARRKRTAGTVVTCLIVMLIAAGLAGGLAAYEYLVARPQYLRALRIVDEKKPVAEKHFQKGRYQESIEAYEESIEAYEESITAYEEAAEACRPVERLLSFQGYHSKAKAMRGECEMHITIIRAEKEKVAKKMAKESRKTKGKIEALIAQDDFKAARKLLLRLEQSGNKEARAWARKQLPKVQKDIDYIEGVLAQVGNFANDDEEFRAVMVLVRRYPNHAKVRKLDVPVRVECEPTGSLVKLPGGAPTPTPCTVRLPVSGATQLTFTRKGYKDKTVSKEAIEVPATRTVREKLERVPAWKVRIGLPVEAPIVLAGTAVIFGDRGGNVWALAAKDGKELWRRPLGRLSAVTGAVAVSEGTVYVGALDRKLYALDLATGRPRWKQPLVCGGLIRSGPRVARVQLLNNRRFVFFGSDDGRVYCADAASGRLRWKSPKLGAVQGSVLVTRKAVYAGSDEGYLHALEPTGGKELWKLKIGSALRGTPILSADGKRIYLGSDGSKLFAVDPAKAARAAGDALVWSRRVGGSIRSGPVLAGGRLFFGSADGTIHAVRPKGRSAEPLWEHKLGARVSAAPLVTPKRVYVGGRDGRFWALDRARDGTPVWSYRTGGRVRSAARWVNGFVLFGSDDGFLYAFDERP